MLTWKPAYETGLELVDSQHKTLFQYINKLETLVAAPAIDTQAVDQLIQFLEHYVANHFKFEENCMQRYHCPAHEANAKAHQQFLEVWGKFRQTYAKEGANRELLSKLHHLDVTWIEHHICKVDTKLRGCVPAVSQ